MDTANPLLRQYISQLQPPLGPTTPTYRMHPSGYPGQIQPNQFPQEQQPRTLQGMHTLNGFAQPEAWDADLGIMPPPQVQPFRPEMAYGLTTTRLYGPRDEHTKSSWGRSGRESWLTSNPTAPYSDVATGSIILGCIILPLAVILVIELATSCLTCCSPFGADRQAKQAGQLRRLIGRLYRLLVTYAFGLLVVMLLTLILQAAIGRLRPEFIKICRPSPNVCPRWATLLRAAGYGFDLNDPNTFTNDPQLLNFLAQESARRGFYLVPRTTTPTPNVMGTGYAEEGIYSDADCTEKNVLRMKYARTSFPSLSAAVTMYATIFLAAYITHTLRYLRRTCFCIPLTLLLGSCLVNLLLGLGRVVYRKNWLEDILAGWALGLIVAAYVLYRALKKRNNGIRVVSNAELLKQLHRIQRMLHSNQEYRQNEVHRQASFKSTILLIICISLFSSAWGANIRQLKMITQ
ncbi:unnamed protein product [Echinostoma caproni]|uniref:Phosphatidic acid phosphatase type 2/haloperoxidase domain-containing protein n=1 Tax=Echinostoma caproni TaxID=27848 RepID=A0A3P8HYF5_9TREM|nr:unnamed protein product [Echinostoma caproni]